MCVLRMICKCFAAGGGGWSCEVGVLWCVLVRGLRLRLLL